MVLDVDPTAPPDLTNRGLPRELDGTTEVDSESALRRAEVEEILREGAWTEAFNEWAEYTDLSEAEYRRIRRAGLFERLDFFWNPVEERLSFEVPALQEPWPDREHPIRNVTTELTDLGRMVVEMLTDAYVDWGVEGGAADIWTEAETPFEDEALPEE